MGKENWYSYEWFFNTVAPWYYLFSNYKFLLYWCEEISNVLIVNLVYDILAWKYKKNKFVLMKMYYLIFNIFSADKYQNSFKIYRVFFLLKKNFHRYYELWVQGVTEKAYCFLVLKTRNYAMSPWVQFGYYLYSFKCVCYITFIFCYNNNKYKFSKKKMLILNHFHCITMTNYLNLYLMYLYNICYLLKHNMKGKPR